MRLVEATAMTAVYVRRMKEDRIQRGQVMGHVVTAFRGDSQICMFTVTSDRDLLLEATDLAASGFGADIVTLSTDVWATELLNHPDTGMPWQHGELDAYTQRHPERSPAEFRCLIATTAYNRADNYFTYMQAYRTAPSRTSRGRTAIQWLDWEPPQASMDRYVDAEVHSILGRPTADVELIRAGIAISETPMWRDHLDLVTAREASRRFGASVEVTMFAEAGSERERLLSTHLRPDELMEPKDINELRRDAGPQTSSR